MHEAIRATGELKRLNDPVLIAAFGGFSDAGGASVATIEFLRRAWNASPLAHIDPQSFYDFTVQRPTVRLDESQERVIDWPATRLDVASPAGSDRDFLLLSGPEPHMRWRTFAAAIAEVLGTTGCTTSVTLGAQPAAVPHTRPIPVTLSASDAEWEEQFALPVPESRYEGPTGMLGVINLDHRERGFRNASLWAQVPHYISVGPDPNAVASLVRVLDRGFRLSTDLRLVEERRVRFEAQVEEAMEDSAEVRTYITRLEEAYDERQPEPAAPGQADAELPSSEELLSDLEDFLRRQQPPEDDA